MQTLNSVVAPIKPSEPRYAVAFIDPQTATLYDYGKGKEIRTLNADYALDSEILAIYEECAVLNAKHEDDLLYLKNIEELVLPARLHSTGNYDNGMRTIRYVNQGDIWLYEKDYHLILDIKDNIMLITHNYSSGKQQSVFLDFMLAKGKQTQKGNGQNLFQYFKWINQYGK